jgi:hypothetical protein
MLNDELDVPGPAGPWTRILLLEQTSDRLRNELPDKLKAVGQDFLANTAAEVAPIARDAANVWYLSSQGQDTLCEFTVTCWRQMDLLADHAMPAHDRRHAMVKVPSSALEYLHSEGVQGFERVGVLAALLHDQGRWAEERIFGGPMKGVLHARMSFVLADELLSNFEMPAVVRSQILFAVLRHSSGANQSDPMPLKLTVSADRDQLYGPEIVLRLLHGAVLADGALSSVYGEKPGSSVLNTLEGYQRNRLPPPLHSMQQHVAWLQWVQRMFILMAEPYDESRRRFAVDIAGEPIGNRLKKQPLVLVEGNAFVWETEWTRAQEARPEASSAVGELKKLLDVKGVAPSAHYKVEALKKIDHLDERRAPLLAGALAWIGEQLRSNDLRQTLALQNIRCGDGADRLTRSLCDLLLNA